ncbi:MAG TPA: DUF1501 domain-containing protein [Kofleriaceae bacterium]
MRVSRRTALRQLLALAATVPAASLACGSRRAEPEAKPVARKPPRKLVVFFLSGGPDGVLTMDPKTTGEVSSFVDNPLHKDNVEVGNVRLGATWAPLARWGHQMAIVHGVQVESANHFAGTWQLLRMRRRGMMSTPGFLDLIARHRDSPLGAITVGNLFNRTYTPSWVPLDGSVTPNRAPQGLSQFDKLPPAELRELAAALRDNARDQTLRPTDRASYERVAAYLDGVQKVGKHEPVDWKLKSDLFAEAVPGMQRVLWALEHDFASAGLVYFGFNKFDTHWRNLERQRETNGFFVRAFDRFLAELHLRRNEHGSLADQTTIVVAGEVGRHPRVNSDLGKDHLPEISMLFMGAGISTGDRGLVLGQNGKDMMGLPMDLKTGRVGGSRHVVLDDIGGTLLRLFEIEPTQYGYPAHPIEPLIG